MWLMYLVRRRFVDWLSVVVVDVVVLIRMVGAAGGKMDSLLEY